MKPKIKPGISSLKHMRRNRPICIAHRGASAWGNENTVRSFEIANKLCADMWEVDVHLSSDGVCVVCHDDDLFRLTGIEINISESLWKELKNIPLKRGGFLSTFKDVVKLCKDLDSWLYIELKGKGTGEAAWNELKEQGFKNAILASFHEDYLLDLYKVDCDYPLSVLVPIGQDPFVMAESSKAEIIHLCWKHASPEPNKLVTNELLKKAKESNLEIILWDEERPKIVQELIQLPVLGICSDKPEMLVPYPKDTSQLFEIVCHRGAESFAPENTLTSVDLAFSQGFKFVEIDVRETLDGIPIVIHDSRVNRTTNSKGKIKDLTHAQATRLDAGSWFDKFFSGEKLPKLEDVLILAKGRGMVYIEIKEAKPKNIIEIVEKTGMLNNTFIWSENAEDLDELSFLNHKVRLMSRRYDFKSLEAAIERHAPYVIEFNGLKFTQEELKHCRDQGILTMSFSMSSNFKTLEKLAESGFDILNLSHPELIKNYFVKKYS